MAKIANYKRCPLKKRPIVFDAEEQEYENHQVLALIKRQTNKNEDQPQDLSLKRKASDDIDEYVLPAKCEYVLNLSKNAESSVNKKYRPESPVSYTSDLSTSSVLLSPKAEHDSSMEYQPSNIHLRGLTAATSGYTTNPYQAAFVMAAGCNPMTLWNTYQPNLTSIFPSPASSIASASSPRSVYSYQHITPPSSPGSEANSEPEDLSVRNDIPLPALFHIFEEAPSSASSNASTSSSSPFGYNSSTASSSNYASSLPSSNNSSNLNKSYRFKCDKCSKMYSTSMGLSKHQQFHCPAAEWNQEKKQHACQDCGKLYTSIGALKMHIRTHTLPCKCPICGKAFSRPWLLQGHIRTHTGEKPFQCPDCPRSFADRSNLRAHQQTHVEIKKYVCKVCNKSFSRMSLLNKHANSNCTITIA